jgi:MFS family permease
MMGSSFFIGNLIGGLFLANLGDKVGRIKMLRAGLTLTIVFYGVIIHVSNSLTLNCIMIFGVGLFSCFRLNISFIYGMEIIQFSKKNIIGSLYNFFDALTMIAVAFYFKYISKDWFPLLNVFLLLSSVACVISFWMPESPKFLISKKKFRGARDSFN